MIRSIVVLQASIHMLCNFTRSDVDLFSNKLFVLHHKDHICEKIDNDPFEAYKKLSSKIEDHIVGNTENRIAVSVSVEKSSKWGNFVT